VPKKKVEITEELRATIDEAARAGAVEAFRITGGAYVNYFKAMERLLYNYKRLAAIVADEEAYCEVEYHGKSKSLAGGALSRGYTESKTEADIVEEMREDRRKQYQRTKRGFDILTNTIRKFEGLREFVVIRMYYFGEDMQGNERDRAYTWEELTGELDAAGVLREEKTARRWRNKIVNDMAICVFGVDAAISAGTYRHALTE
jgi:hypothetical protein